MVLSRVYTLFTTNKKNFKFNLTLAVFLILNSKDLYYCLLKWEGYNVIQTSTDPEKDFCISLQKVSACERSRM